MKLILLSFILKNQFVTILCRHAHRHTHARTYGVWEGDDCHRQFIHGLWWFILHYTRLIAQYKNSSWGRHHDQRRVSPVLKKSVLYHGKNSIYSMFEEHQGYFHWVCVCVCALVCSLFELCVYANQGMYTSANVANRSINSQQAIDKQTYDVAKK